MEYIQHKAVWFPGDGAPWACAWDLPVQAILAYAAATDENDGIEMQPRTETESLAAHDRQRDVIAKGMIWHHDGGTLSAKPGKAPAIPLRDSVHGMRLYAVSVGR